METPNPELHLAGEYVRHTGCHVFLTGKAGTGKTTFLHTLKADSPKRLVVTAPTGVAAINAGGVTLHSFFQLPFGPFVPGSEVPRSRFRYSKAKIGLIKSLDLLVIDEISMVRADLLDGVDHVLRRFRRRDLPFGGVQLLMIGDLFQLPPVVRDQDWRLLQPTYDSPYFFSSTALQQTAMVTIELRHVYRQADRDFIHLLNRVRNNRLDPAVLEALNTRHRADFTPGDREGYITLCTHNQSADRINTSRLGELKPQAHMFTAEIEGDFPEPAYPTAATLKLKRGAQVMFVRNDPSPEKRYFNGKIGTITGISGQGVRIQCPGDPGEIVVEPATWENIDYQLNPETQEIAANKIGTFKQYPLRLAWAITIHKSQGLTFDRAIIDAQAAFTHGQVYVALSRCRSFDGLVLTTPIPSRAIINDPAVRQFSQATRQHAPTADHLAAAKILYQQQLLLECFDFQHLRSRLRRMVALLSGNPGMLHGAGDDIHALQKSAEEEICTVGDNFRRQLQGLFSASTLPAEDAVILGRLAKAADYFQEKIAGGPGRIVPELQIDTDNQALGKKINQARAGLQEEIAVKLAAVQSCRDGFSPARYFRAVSAAVVNLGKSEAKPKAATCLESDIAHPELFQILKNWRHRKAEAEKIAPYQVLHQKTLIQIAVHLPDTLPALKQIKGIGKQLAARYGEELVAMVADHRRQHQIAVVARPTPAEKLPAKQATSRVDTRQASFDLFQQGLGPVRIAAERGLALSTIEGHLAHFVESGQIAVSALVPPENRHAIEQEIGRAPEKSMGEIKQALGPGVSYGEIRLVQADMKRRLGEKTS